MAGVLGLPQSHLASDLVGQPQERLNKEVAAATTSSASSPTTAPSSASSAPCSPNDTTNGSRGKRYLGLEVLARFRTANTDPTEQRKPPPAALTA